MKPKIPLQVTGSGWSKVLGRGGTRTTNLRIYGVAKQEPRLQDLLIMTTMKAPRAYLHNLTASEIAVRNYRRGWYVSARFTPVGAQMPRLGLVTKQVGVYSTLLSPKLLHCVAVIFGA